MAKKSGLNPTVVSRNNGFLVSVGALSPGRDKELTPLGSRLAIAVGNNLPDDIISAWKEIILHCESTRSVIEMVKIQKGVPKDQFTNRVASTLGVVGDTSTRTGLNTLADLFVESKTLRLAEDRFVVSDEALVVREVQEVPPKGSTLEPAVTEPSKEKAPPSGLSSYQPPILHVNIQIHISPESTPEQIEKIFECMSKHLRPTS